MSGKGIYKLFKLSPQMSSFLKKDEASRVDITRGLYFL